MVIKLGQVRVTSGVYSNIYTNQETKIALLRYLYISTMSRDVLELRYCRWDHKVKGSLERASLKADFDQKGSVHPTEVVEYEIP